MKIGSVLLHHDWTEANERNNISYLWCSIVFIKFHLFVHNFILFSFYVVFFFFCLFSCLFSEKNSYRYLFSSGISCYNSNISVNGQINVKVRDEAMAAYRDDIDGAQYIKFKLTISMKWNCKQMRKNETNTHTTRKKNNNSRTTTHDKHESIIIQQAAQV